MKFGKYIQSASSDWATPWYMEYKGLKKIISALESASSRYTLLAAPPPEDDQLKTTFFYKLDRELDKVNGFYVQKETQFRNRLRALSEKLRLYEKRKRIQSLNILKEAHVQFINDLAKLHKFVMINYEGFRKILKKYDKRTKSATKDAYMARQVKIKPCFNSKSQTELTDIASNQLMEITKLLKTLDTSNSVNLQENDSEISLQVKSSSPIEINALDLNEFESNLLECIQSNQVLSLSELLEKRRFEQGDEYCVEDLEIMGRIFLNVCNEASLEVLDCLLNHVPQLLGLGIRDDISDRTPLHELAITGRIKILKMLLEKGLNDDPEDTYGRRPIHYSSMYGHISSSLLLISYKTDLELPDHDGATPLVHAIRGGHVQLIELLLESGVNLEYSSELIQNPLIVAVQMGNLEITEKLLQRGVQILPDSQGLTPLHISCRMGYSDIASSLIKYGAQIDACDNFYGWQPIFFAASEGNLDCVRVLIEAGCILEVKDENGWFPWTFALYHGHIEVAKLLEDSSQGTSSSGQAVDGSVRPMVPSELFVSEIDKLESEIDTIPSLSLPPPIIPCRI